MALCVLCCTSENVSLIHVVSAEDSDSASSAALQQRPDLVSGAGVHACCGLIQEQDLSPANKGLLIVTGIFKRHCSFRRGYTQNKRPSLKLKAQSGTLGSPRMAMPTDSFLFWPPLRFLAWAVMIFSKSRSFSTLLTYQRNGNRRTPWTYSTTCYSPSHTIIVTKLL